ncbi:MAG TPA: MarR family transcriptional regulator [Gemmatirosa sp.]
MTGGRDAQTEARTAALATELRVVILRLERDGPASVAELARAEGVRPQSMGATVAVLEAAGLVDGTPDPTGGRRTVLSLTAV